MESDYYDAGVLEGLLHLKQFFESEVKALEVEAEDRPHENFILDTQQLEKVDRIRQATPDPQAFILSGDLNAIEHSHRRFQLVLSNGHTIPGRLDETFLPVEGMREFWGRKVTVKGIVRFKPSRKIQLLEAHSIKRMEPGEELFEGMPSAQSEMEFVREAIKSSDKGDWLNQIRGQWPGDESFEELLADLDRRGK
jgi:hypothetical protein